MPQENDEPLHPSRHPPIPQNPPSAILPGNVLKKDDEALERDKKLKELENR